MKKPFSAFMVCCLAVGPAFSASTCETRVDQHQDATTLERAAYCLTPEAEQPVPAGPELVYYGVSANPPQDREDQTARYRQKYFNKDGVAVAQDYVGTRSFPSFTNDTLSEQERLALEKAEKEAWEKAQAEAKKKAATAQAPFRTPSVLEEQEPPMSKAQLASRKNKPKRFMKEPVAETAPQSEEFAPAGQDVYSDASLYETGTPQGELQDVQALNNDSLTQPAADAAGAAPDGFLDDDLMADDPSFGYNATDPAMQP